MNNGWFGINSQYLDSSCDGESATLKGALDGVGTYWAHDVSENPHWLILDLKRSYFISSVRSFSDTVVDPTSVNIYVSDDKNNWGDAVASGISSWQNTASYVEVALTRKKGRYVKFEVVDSEVQYFLNWGSNDATVPLVDLYCEQLPDKFTFPINIQNDGLLTSSDSYVDTNFRIPWNGSKYDTLEGAFFVANLYTPTEFTGITAQLYNFTDDIEITTLSVITGGGYTLVKSGDILANLPTTDAEKHIGIKIKRTGSSNEVAIREAAMFVTVAAPENSGTPKVRLIRDVGWVRPARAIFSTSYAERQCKRLLYESNKFDGTMTVYFGATAKVSQGTFYTELRNETDASQVAELTWTETVATYKMSSSISLTNNKEYTTRVKVSADVGDDGEPYNAHILIELSNFSKCEFDYMIAMTGDTNTLFSTTSYVNSNSQQFYLNFSRNINVTLYAESCAKKSVSDTGSTKLYENGVAMSNSQLDFSSTSFARIRGASALTEPAHLSDVELWGKGKTSTGTLQVYVARVIKQISNFEKTQNMPNFYGLASLTGVQSLTW